MIKRILWVITLARRMQQITMSLARAGASACVRTINVHDPNSWEFSGFSQNGEDGIIDFLCQQIKHPNHYFIEIGSSYGVDNNTAWLAIGKKFNGIMVEGNPKALAQAALLYGILNIGVECINAFVTKNNISQLKDWALHHAPDLFSLDIDGNDYYIAEDIMRSGFKPKIIVVEYNSAFGPSQKLTISYEDNFNMSDAHETHLYYGVSISGWRRFFEKWGYRFLTVDRNGVNAFFVNPAEFESEFIDKLRGLEFQENFYQMRKFRVPWDKQWELIKNMNYLEIE